MNIQTVTYRIQSFETNAGWVPWVGVYTAERDVRLKLKEVLDEGVWKASEIRLVKVTTMQTVEVLP